MIVDVGSQIGKLIGRGVAEVIKDLDDAALFPHKDASIRGELDGSWRAQSTEDSGVKIDRRFGDEVPAETLLDRFIRASFLDPRTAAEQRSRVAILDVGQRCGWIQRGGRGGTVTADDGRNQLPLRITQLKRT